MKILLSNKYYYPRGGDCIYTISLENLLKKNGHDVAVFAMDYPENVETRYAQYFPSEISFSFSKNINLVESFFRPYGTKEVKVKFTKLLDDFHPDVVHLNNIHTQLSPVLAKIAHNRGIKVVWTLHDYKLLCPRYDCLRNDKHICELCFTDKKNVIINKCMKNSIIASAMAYVEALIWNKERLQSFTDCFICPSEFINNKMKIGGFDHLKLHSLYNFIDTSKTKKNNFEKDDYYCYIGRLSHEKGIETLIEVANTLPFKLKIIGSGPMKEFLIKKTCSPNIEFVGYKQWHEIKDIIGKARFIVIPSEWYENNPLSIIESLSLGTPVLGANIGGIPEIIENGVNGMLFETKNKTDLESKIIKMMKTDFEYQTIYSNSNRKFSSEIYYTRLLEIYQHVLNEH